MAVRAALKEREVPDGDEWRLPYLQRLLEQRLEFHYRGLQEEEMRTQDLSDSLCIN